MLAPWNEIRPKKYPSPGMPVVQLWQNLCNPSYAIPLGFTPWNSFSACLLGKSDSIGEDSRNLLKPDGTIPLGTCQLDIAFTFEL